MIKAGIGIGIVLICTVFVQIHYTSESHVRFLFYEKVVSGVYKVS